MSIKLLTSFEDGGCNVCIQICRSVSSPLVMPVVLFCVCMHAVCHHHQSSSIHHHHHHHDHRRHHHHQRHHFIIISCMLYAALPDTPLCSPHTHSVCPSQHSLTHPLCSPHTHSVCPSLLHSLWCAENWDLLCCCGRVNFRLGPSKSACLGPSKSAALPASTAAALSSAAPLS